MALRFARGTPQYATLATAPEFNASWSMLFWSATTLGDVEPFNPESVIGLYDDGNAEVAAADIDAASDGGWNAYTTWALRRSTMTHASELEVTAGYHKCWLVFDSGADTLRLFVDDDTDAGVIETITPTYTGGTDTSMRWACRPGTAGSFPWSGDIGRVSLWTAALTEAERAAETGMDVVKTASLWAHYDNETGTTMGQDSSGNARHMTLVGSPTDVADPSYPGGGGTLDCDAGVYTMTGNAVGMNVNETVIAQDVWTTTFQHEGDKQSGQFADGSYWIEGPVDWVSEDPVFAVDGGGRDRYGTTIDPTYDSNRGGWSPGRLLHGFGTIQQPGGYSRARNASYDLTLGTVTITPASGSYVSLVKCINEAVYGGDEYNDAEAFRIVTVVASDRIPAVGDMRPWVAGPVKQPTNYSVDSINQSVLPTLAAVAVRSDSTRRDAVEAMFTSGPILDLDGSTWQGAMLPNTSTGIGNYQRDVATHVSEALLFCASSLRTDALIEGVVQLGVDIYGNIRNGWMSPDGGGHVHGREVPINFAGELLGDATLDVNALLAIVGDFRGTRMQWFYVAETSAGVYNYGNGGYGISDVGVAEWGLVHNNFDPAGVGSTYDNVVWTGVAYRYCCTANSCWGLALVSRKMGLDETWCQAFFDYMTRYHDVEYARVGYEWTLDNSPSQWMVRVFEDEGYTALAASLTCESGAYTLTGYDSFLVEQPGLHCDAGTYSLTGVDVALGSNELVCESGIYSFLGYGMSVDTQALDCAAGSYAMTGSPMFMQTPYSGGGAAVVVGGNAAKFFFFNRHRHRRTR